MSELNVITKERTAVINPIVTCQPLGAMYAVSGIERGMPLVHGSQGCSTFVRYGFARHFREPADIAVTSLHEDAAVFGGRKNLISGLGNLAARFKPDVMGVVTTCSSEIIGDDVAGFIKTAKVEIAKKMGEEAANKIKIVQINTPSFVEHQFKGYDNAIKAIVDTLAEPKDEENGKLIIIPGIVNPGDIREIKHMLSLMGVEGILLTDTSDPFDSPLRPSKADKNPYYQKGGTPLADLQDCANSLGTISLANYANSAPASLEKKYNMPSKVSEAPIGIQNTDSFIRTVKKFTGNDVTDEILDERGIVIDAMADVASRYLFGRKVAIYGDPSITVGMARFVAELGMIPKVVCTGVKNEYFVNDLKKVAKESDEDIDALFGQDLRALDVYLKENPVDLMIGSSDGRLMAKDLGIPLYRVGYPVYDRVGYQRRPIIGYNGALNLVDGITNTILDKYYETQDWKLQQ
uniref:Nitrogenase molybdenum-iron protein beta chain n=1 Tax=Methanococcus maripaludis TaxID=39152 RepID=NIFK_METMI|nr:RecName: Full=Nitrogenase molybdenum-iron protein beta chain; AltName: Full=Dinitrogenase; AltName: Full=Nitrogenase component I [Methanococcus maripaludis]AAC45516.1 dinitrogenase beta subunit [Methanococcus maripaludis]